MASDIVVFGTFVVLRFEALLGSFMYQDSIAAMWGASPGFPLGFHWHQEKGERCLVPSPCWGKSGLLIWPLLIKAGRGLVLGFSYSVLLVKIGSVKGLPSCQAAPFLGLCLKTSSASWDCLRLFCSWIWYPVSVSVVVASPGYVEAKVKTQTPLCSVIPWIPRSPTRLTSSLCLSESSVLVCIICSGFSVSRRMFSGSYRQKWFHLILARAGTQLSLPHESHLYFFEFY